MRVIFLITYSFQMERTHFFKHLQILSHVVNQKHSSISSIARDRGYLTYFRLKASFFKKLSFMQDQDDSRKVYDIV